MENGYSKRHPEVAESSPALRFHDPQDISVDFVVQLPNESEVDGELVQRASPVLPRPCPSLRSPPLDQASIEAAPVMAEAVASSACRPAARRARHGRTEEREGGKRVGSTPTRITFVVACPFARLLRFGQEKALCVRRRGKTEVRKRHGKHRHPTSDTARQDDRQEHHAPTATGACASRKSYEKQKYRLQVELLKLQAWVKESGQRVVILFEGRDAAGKGGTIRRFMEHLNPRGARVVALEKPSEAERGQWYFQRYVQHLPTAGEIVLFDRSWYNRAGVENAMGFCRSEEYEEFMRQAPVFERNLVASGTHLIKFWFSVSRPKQRRRFKERETHPLKHW